MRVCGELPERRSRPRSRPHRALPRRHACRWFGLLFALSLAAPAPVAAQPPHGEPSPPFVLSTASVRAVGEVYRLNAVADLRLTPGVREALDNGIDLTLTWEVSIERTREWWLDAEVAHIVQRYRLSLHELTRQYIVTNLNTGQRRSYTYLQTALERIGELDAFPLVDRVLIKDGERLLGHVRIRLQHDELPLPLRAVALFSDDWDLESGWFQWRFE